MKDTFLDTNYVTIPIEQFEDLIRESQSIRDIKRVIVHEKCMSLRLLCSLLSMPVPDPDFRSVTEIKEDVENDLIV